LPFLHRCIGKGLSLLFRRGKVLFYPGGCHCKNASWIEGGGGRKGEKLGKVLHIAQGAAYAPSASLRLD